VNIFACFLIGLSVEYLNRHAALDPAWRFLIPVGFIGGFSTFSTFEWETWTDISSGAFWIGITYVVVSVVAGFVSVAAGVAAARSLR
jgi:CrcB protein